MSGFMPIGDYKVTYTDGSSEVVTSNFLGICEVERRYPNGEIPGVNAMGLAVWYYLDCPGGDLDAWLKTVHMIEQATDSTEAPEVPTDPAPGDD
jgi:hypothetical protein